MNPFWWGNGGTDSRGIHWFSRNKLSMHKSNGGMGFHNLYAFNLAMLGKQGWPIITSPNSLVSRTFKAKYFPNFDLVDKMTRSKFGTKLGLVITSLN